MLFTFFFGSNWIYVIDTFLSDTKHKFISQKEIENSLMCIVLVKDEIFSFCSFYILSEIILALFDAI